MLVPFEAETVLVAHESTGLHTQQCVVSLVVGLIDIVRVVSRKQRCADLVCDLNQLGVRAQLVSNAMVLHFDKQIVFSENVLQAASFSNGTLLIAIQQRLQHMAAEATRRSNQTFGVAL